jgi:hypothetical protein
MSGLAFALGGLVAVHLASNVSSRMRHWYLR